VTLPARLIELHAALDAAGIPHAFGGAIALAYVTDDPRGTRDIDVNVFLPPDEAQRVLAALPHGVAVTDQTVEAIERDGQTRLWWDSMPVDLFFDYHPVHVRAADHQRLVEFEGQMIPVLGPRELAIFKAVFDRPRDWGDLDRMAESGTLEIAALRDALIEMFGADDARLARLADLEERYRR
jgi:hypothetical protein